MSIDIQEILNSLTHPPIRHAALVHMPIALSALGLLLLLLLLFTGGRSSCLRWSTVVLFLVAAGLAYVTAWSGEQADDHLALDVKERVAETLSDHEWFGEWAWIPLAVTGVLAALTAMPGLPARIGFLALAILAGVFCAGWLAMTAHHGGQLVYVHGVGVGTGGDAAKGRTAPDVPVIEVPDKEVTPEELGTVPGTKGDAGDNAAKAPGEDVGAGD